MTLEYIPARLSSTWTIWTWRYPNNSNLIKIKSLSTNQSFIIWFTASLKLYSKTKVFLNNKNFKQHLTMASIWQLISLKKKALVTSSILFPKIKNNPNLFFQKWNFSILKSGQQFSLPIANFLPLSVTLQLRLTNFKISTSN